MKTFLYFSILMLTMFSYITHADHIENPENFDHTGWTTICSGNWRVGYTSETYKNNCEISVNDHAWPYKHFYAAQSDIYTNHPFDGAVRNDDPCPNPSTWDNLTQTCSEPDICSTLQGQTVILQFPPPTNVISFNGCSVTQTGDSTCTGTLAEGGYCVAEHTYDGTGTYDENATNEGGEFTGTPNPLYTEEGEGSPGSTITTEESGSSTTTTDPNTGDQTTTSTGTGNSTEESNGTGSASQNCQLPPVCSGGDPQLCAILRQQWETMCHSEGEDTEVAGNGTCDSAQRPVCTGENVDILACSILQQDWDMFCSILDDRNNAITDMETYFTGEGLSDLDSYTKGQLMDELLTSGNGEDDGEIDLENSIGNFLDANNTAGTCPADLDVPTKFGNLTFSFQFFCDLADAIRMVVLMAASMFGGTIVLRSIVGFH